MKSLNQCLRYWAISKPGNAFSVSLDQDRNTFSCADVLLDTEVKVPTFKKSFKQLVFLTFYSEALSLFTP